MDEEEGGGINSFLVRRGDVEGNPFRLAANAGKAFQGSILLGDGFVVDSAPHRNAARPALSRGRGSRFVSFSESEFNAVSHVGVPLPNHSVSPLSLRERARVRAAI